MKNFDFKKYLAEGILLKETQNNQIKKGAINESILGTIALGATIGMGVNWLKKKKQQLDRASDIADRIQGRKDEEKYFDDLKAAEKAALDQTEIFLKDPNNQELINKIKTDPEIKNWIMDIDQSDNKNYDEWRRSGGGSSYEQYPMPHWGIGKEDVVKKIEDKIKELGGEQLLNLMNTSKTKLGNLK